MNTPVKYITLRRVAQDIPQLYVRGAAWYTERRRCVMTIEHMRLKVVSPIHGIRFVGSGPVEVWITTIKKTGECEYDIDCMLDLSAEKKNEMGAVTHWKVRAAERPDTVITANELAAWRHECVIELAQTA